MRASTVPRALSADARVTACSTSCLRAAGPEGAFGLGPRAPPGPSKQGRGAGRVAASLTAPADAH